MARGEIRAVTHLDVRREDIDTAIAPVAAVARTSPESARSVQPRQGY